MAVKWFMLFFFAICTAETLQKQDGNWKPPCEKFIDLDNCPTHEVPVCGTDGKTYNNLCLLCAQTTRTKEDILVTKRGKC